MRLLGYAMTHQRWLSLNFPFIRLATLSWPLSDFIDFIVGLFFERMFYYIQQTTWKIRSNWKTVWFRVMRPNLRNPLNSAAAPWSDPQLKPMYAIVIYSLGEFVSVDHCTTYIWTCLLWAINHSLILRAKVCEIWAQQVLKIKIKSLTPAKISYPGNIPGDNAFNQFRMIAENRG